MISRDRQGTSHLMKCRIGLDGSWQEVPPHFCELLGYTQYELLELTVHDVTNPDDREKWRQIIEQLQAGELREFETEQRCQRKTGEPVWLYVSGVRLNDEDGNPDYLLCYIHDILTSKHEQERLAASEQRLKSLFEHNPHPVFHLDKKGKFRGVNTRFEELSGYSEEELKGKSYHPLIHSDFLGKVHSRFKQTLNGEVQEYEVLGITREGKERNVKITSFPIYVQGIVEGIYGICEDITSEKKAERKLKRSEQRFRSLFENNPNAVFSFGRDGNFELANKALEQLTGYTNDELRKMSFDRIVAPEDREFVREMFEKTARGMPQTYEAGGIHKDGSKFYVQVANLPIYVDGEIEGIFGIAHDVTREKRALRRLEESEERWQRLVEENPQPVQLVQNGKIVFINQAGLKLYGASDIDDLIGREVMDFCHPEYAEILKNRKERLEKNQSISAGELILVRLDGEERFIETHSIPIKFKGEAAIQTVIHDITERKKKEQNIKSSLSEKEVLLQEIHHRVKNNLAVISGLLELQAMNSDDEATINTLRESQMRIQSMAMIHKKLYQSEALSNIGFDKYVKELVEAIRQTYDVGEQNIAIEFDIDSVNLGIEQAISAGLIVNELLANSFKHAFEGKDCGTIAINLRQKESEIQLSVIDDGQGMDLNFDIESLQTLGMTLVSTLTRQLEGELDYSTPSEGSGTKCTIRFQVE